MAEAHVVRRYGDTHMHLHLVAGFMSGDDQSGKGERGGQPLVSGSSLLHLHAEGQALLDLQATHRRVAKGGERVHEFLDARL